MLEWNTGQHALMEKKDHPYFAFYRIPWQRASLVPRGMTPETIEWNMII